MAAAVPEDGLTDVHRYMVITLGHTEVTIDVTFPAGQHWDGRSPMPLACGPGQDFPAGEDPDADKAALEAQHCDPDVREPFIAALACVPALPGVSSPEMIRGLQERAARAFPAERVEDAEGWWLRHAPGCGWWVGSVLPHGEAGPGELVRRVAGAEKFYAAHGAVARFQVSPPACPHGLDTLLAGRGYRREGLMSLQVASTAHVTGRLLDPPLRVDVDDRPGRAWFGIWHAVHGRDVDPRGERDMLERVEPPYGYARAMLGDDVVAVGRVVADTGWAGVFGMATLPQARGKGASRCVLTALARWAASQHVGHMYLQVERGNMPALRLYEQAGFTGICHYRYRTAG